MSGLKPGGGANTIAVVNGIRKAVGDLLDVPKSLVTNVVFDQSVFVKTAIGNLLHEGAIGLCLTGLIIMVFLGNVRATVAVFLSIPLSALATFLCLSFGDHSRHASRYDRSGGCQGGGPPPADRPQRRTRPDCF